MTEIRTGSVPVRGLWSPGRRRLTAGLVAGVTLVALESLSVETVLPTVGRQLGHINLYGWVFSAFFLTSLVGIAAAGAAADRRGLAVPLSGGLACFAAGLLVGGLAPSMPVLVAGRALQGLGAGAVPAAAYAAIGRAYAPEVRPKMFAILSTAWVAPAVVGPSLAAVVADGPGWRWVLLGLLPAVALAAVVAVPALGAVPGPVALPAEGSVGGSGGERESSTLAASSVTALGAAMVLAGLSAGSLLVVPATVVGLAVAASGLRRLLPTGTWRAAPGLPAAVATRGVLTFGYFSVDAYVPLTLSGVRHTSTAVGGVALTAATLTWTAGSWLQARVVATIGPRRLVRAGLSTLVVGIALFAACLSHDVPVPVALVAWGVAGFGIGLAYSPLSVTALAWAPAGAGGRAASALQLTDTLGTALGTGAGGAAVALGHRHGWPAWEGLGMAFAVAVAVLAVAQVAASGVPTSMQRPD